LGTILGAENPFVHKVVPLRGPPFIRGRPWDDGPLCVPQRCVEEPFFLTVKKFVNTACLRGAYPG